MPQTLFTPNADPKPTYQSSRNGRATLYRADALEWLDAQPPNSIHAVVTDPPYGMVEYSETEQAKLRASRRCLANSTIFRRTPAGPVAPIHYTGFRRSPATREFLPFMGDQAAARTGSRALRDVRIASNPLLSYLVANAVVNAGFERRGEIMRLVMTMRGGDRPKNAHDEFPDVSVMPRSMWAARLLFAKAASGPRPRQSSALENWRHAQIILHTTLRRRNSFSANPQIRATHRQSSKP